MFDKYMICEATVRNVRRDNETVAQSSEHACPITAASASP